MTRDKSGQFEGKIRLAHRLSRLGTSSSIPLGHDPSIPPGLLACLSRLGTSSSVPLGHELVFPTWARGSSVPLGHEARLSHLACDSSSGRLATHSILVLAALPGRGAHTLPPVSRGASCRQPAWAGPEPARALRLAQILSACDGRCCARACSARALAGACARPALGLAGYALLRLRLRRVCGYARLRRWVALRCGALMLRGAGVN